MDGYFAWMLVATALVLMMTTPALALFYGGLSRSKSTLNMMMMSYVSVGVVGIVFVLWGWSEAGFNNSYGNGKLFSNPFSMWLLHGNDWHATADSTGSTYIWVAFQLTFAVITAALISGSLEGRVKMSSWTLFIIFWVTLCYFPVAHNVWGGGWLANWLIGEQDYAGGTVVHINAGVAGLVLALIIGKRRGFGTAPMKPHNVPTTLIGAGLLWVGWYGFNVGSIVFVTQDADGNPISVSDQVAQFMGEAGATFLNTTVATMAAMLGWLVAERIAHGKATAVGAASGIVAGLVAVTPACGAVNLFGAICIGAIAGILCALAVSLKFKFGFDDSLDVVGVHLVGGLVGTVLIGFFSTSGAPGGIDGLFYGGGGAALASQVLAALFTIVWTGVLTTILGLLIKYTIGWRVRQEVEVSGIDIDQHGEAAYDWGTPGSLVLEGASA